MKKSTIGTLAALTGIGFGILKQINVKMTVAEDSPLEIQHKQFEDFKNKNDTISLEEAIAIHDTVSFSVEGIPGTWADPVLFGDLFVTRETGKSWNPYFDKSRFSQILAVMEIARHPGFDNDNFLLSLIIWHLRGDIPEFAKDHLHSLSKNEQQKIFGNLALLRESILNTDTALQFNKNIGYNVRRVVYESRSPRYYKEPKYILSKSTLMSSFAEYVSKELTSLSTERPDVDPSARRLDKLTREALWLQYLQLIKGGNPFLVEPIYEPPSDLALKGDFYWVRSHNEALLPEIFRQFEYKFGAPLMQVIQAENFEPTEWIHFNRGKPEIFEAMGNFSVRLEEDSQGRYIELYDFWDLHPIRLKVEASTFIPNAAPFGLYHRIYEDEICAAFNQIDMK